MRKLSAALLTAFLVLAIAPGQTQAGTATVAVGSTVGAPQKLFGPTGLVDSVYATVRDSKGRLFGYLSNHEARWYHQRPNGRLTNGRLIMSGGGRGSVDQCGVHPAGTIYKDPAAPRSHWITFYHAEEGAPVDGGKCNHSDRHTRWTIVRMETFNGGRTWLKRGQVITQDRALLRTPAGDWSFATDDVGSPRLVISGKYMYLFFRATNRSSDEVQEMTLARAPLRSKGKPGAWTKFYNGSFIEPGLGGRSSDLSGLPASARGISRNSYLHRWLAVQVTIEGTFLFQSTDLLNWSPLQRVAKKGLTESAWHQPCGREGLPPAYGYGSIIGRNGSSSASSKSFWVYYMKKPAGKCFDHRYLYRRPVTLP